MTRPVPGPPLPWRFPAVERDALPNGLALRVCHLPGQSLASAFLVLPRGAASEPPGAYGGTHAYATALLSGRLLDDAEELGAVANADVTWDALTLTLTAPAAVLPAILGALARAVCDPPLDATVADEVRRRRTLEVAREDADPRGRARRALARAVFGGSRYGTPLGGDAPDVARIDLDGLLASHAGAALPAYATLVVAGDTTVVDVRRAAEHAFGAWGGTGVPAPPVAAPARSAEPGVLVVDTGPGPRSDVALGCATPARPLPGFAALALAADCLSGTPGARLNRRLRDTERLVYGAYGGVDAWRRGGLYSAAFSCAAEVTGDAVAAALDEARDVAAGGLGEAEVAAARDHRVGAMPLHLHTPPAVAAAVAANAAALVADDAHALLRAEIAACGAVETAAAARRHLGPDRLVVVVAGDAGRVVPALGRAGVAASVLS